MLLNLIIGAAVILTYSRGAMLALAVMTVLLLAALRVRVMHFAIAVAAAVLLIFALPSNVTARLVTVEKILPGAAKLITCSGGDLPVASKVDDALLRGAYPGLLRIPLAQGIRETVDVFTKMNAAGKLEVFKTKGKRRRSKHCNKPKYSGSWSKKACTIC